MGKLRIVLVGLVLAGAVGVISFIGLASATGSAKPNRAESRQAHAARRCDAGPAVHQVSRSLRAHFAVFRRVRPADVSKPSQVANPHVVARLKLKLSCTQLVRTRSGPVWVVPGGDGACVMSGQASATIAPQPGQNDTGCGTTKGILQNGEVVQAGQAGGPNIVFGLVPNGNARVTLTLATGVQQQVSVIDNVVKATVPAGPVTVAFRNAAGRRRSLRYPG